MVKNNISLEDLKKMSEKMFGGIVKAVIDVEKEIMAVDADLHADLEGLLLDQESKQENLWGINLHPENIGNENFVEFDSMINLRPSWGNKSRGVDDLNMQKKIKEIVNKLVTP